MYDVRRAIDSIADVGSVLELRRGFGLGMVTTLARVEGRPVGIVANNPIHLAGAIDADGADKAARFMQLCDAFDVPIVFLCDTPGIMVGPDAEATALVRHVSRLFVTGANLSVPFATVILRKAYGLGAQAMAGGSFKAPLFCVSWPSGELGGMGLEGAVRLGYRKELEAIDDPAARQRAFDEMVERMYEHGKALNAASHFEIDDVIDPADTRHWISSAFAASPPEALGPDKKRPNIDTWLMEGPSRVRQMTRLWTGKGDDGTTGLLYGGRARSRRHGSTPSVTSTRRRPASAWLGLEVPGGSELDVILTVLERDLWVLMAELATDDDNRSKLVPGGSLVTLEMITTLETVADDIGGRFSSLESSSSPAKTACPRSIDLARTVVRRAERSAAAVVPDDSLVVPYLNRLSSVLFTLARWVEGEPLLARGR